jgi:predicted HicB family RNase H-like nuclease
MSNVIQLNYKGFSSQASYDEECQEWHGRIYLPNWWCDGQFFSGQNEWWVRREFQRVIDYYLEITQYWNEERLKK